MSDPGKIDINISGGGANGPKKASADKAESNPTSSTNSVKKQTNIENKSVYKNSSISQRDLGFDAVERITAEQIQEARLNKNTAKKQLDTSLQQVSEQSESGLNKDYDMRSANPILYAKMQNRKKANSSNKKRPKQFPPDESLQVKMSPRKGMSINPRKPQSVIPNRLQGFSDDGSKPMDKLINAMADENLIISDATKSRNSDFVKSETSFANILDLNFDIMKFSKEELIDHLGEKLDLLINEPELEGVFLDIIDNIAIALNQDEVLVQILQLFYPLPFPFTVFDIDDEFEEDEDEMRQDFEDDEEEESEDQEDEEEISLSVRTMNFNKVHFMIKHKTKSNKMTVGIKGDPSSTELIIPIESNLEDVLEFHDDEIEYFMNMWREGVFRAGDNRILKMRSSGKISSSLLKASVSVLDTIYKSDEEMNEQDITENDLDMLE